MPSLSEEAFREAVKALCARDRDLGGVIDRFGPPPRWTREPGFPALVRIILEQQVSLASARATFERLLEVQELTPEAFLILDDRTLKRVGFSRQKTAYCRGLASMIREGELDLQSVENEPDEEARATLQRVKGIGRWTADVYLLMALRRPDVWPVGDLALHVAAQQVKGLPERREPTRSKSWPSPGDLGGRWRRTSSGIITCQRAGSEPAQPPPPTPVRDPRPGRRRGGCSS